MRNRCGSLSRHKYLLAAILLILVLYNSLPTATSTISPHTEESDNRPRYLHQSPFRANPDYDYEIAVSDALQKIESDRSVYPAATDTIWQIILSPKDQRKDDSYEFQKRNPGWRYQLINAHWADNFITKTLASIPDLARLYKSYPHYVQRGDLLRYLVLWYYGGYYADVDVYPAKSIKSCPTLRNVFEDLSIGTSISRNVSLVVGVEIDEPLASPQKMREWHWARRYGFLQYNIYAPQRFSPLLREVIVRVLSHTKHHVESHFWGRYDEMTTLEVTGPGVFTDAILDKLSDTLPSTHPFIEESLKAGKNSGDTSSGDLMPSSLTLPAQRVTWAPFHDLTDTVCAEDSDDRSGRMGGICVLPVNSWGNGQRHSGAEGFNSPHSCINHRFGGTWKPWKQSWKKYLFG
ncbi:unnamed protein product [Penicillium salamii]|nr:unnamed protein product [Penicillium salamii]CAG8152664.1 unnamed protein product [Penicillium salamii]CAG8402697.1 unnamed protein product [Penicillium salamii]